MGPENALEIAVDMENALRPNPKLYANVHPVTLESLVTPRNVRTTVLLPKAMEGASKETVSVLQGSEALTAKFGLVSMIALEMGNARMGSVFVRLGLMAFLVPENHAQILARTMEHVEIKFVFVSLDLRELIVLFLFVQTIVMEMDCVKMEDVYVKMDLPVSIVQSRNARRIAI